MTCSPAWVSRPLLYRSHNSSLVVDLLEIPGTKRVCFYLRVFAPALLVLGKHTPTFHNPFLFTCSVTHRCFQMLTMMALLTPFFLTQVKFYASVMDILSLFFLTSQNKIRINSRDDHYNILKASRSHKTKLSMQPWF